MNLASLWSKDSFKLLSISVVPIIIIMFFYPVFSLQEFDTDEGMTIARAFAMHQGGTLYQDIWSDQPPLYTLIMYILIPFKSVPLLRLLTLLFTVFLLWSGAMFLNLLHAKQGAFLFPFMLSASFLFPKLMSSIMIGIPAVSLFTGSLMFLLWFLKSDKIGYLMLSAMLLSGSLLVKFICIYLLPLHLVLVLLHKPSLKTFRNSALIYASILAFLLAFTLYFSGFFYGMDQVANKLSDESSKAFQAFDNWWYIKNQFWKLRTYFILFFATIPFLIKTNKAKLMIIPTLWFVMTIIVFFSYSPLWYHYVLLMSLPLSMALAINVGSLIQVLKVNLNIKAIYSLLGINVLGLALFLVETNRLKSEIKYDQKVLQEVYESIQSHEIVFTDRPFYAFVNNNPIIPELAVFSDSRLKSGHLSSRYLVDLLEKHQVNHVVLGRFEVSELGEDFAQKLKSDFYLESTESAVISYKRRDLIR